MWLIIFGDYDVYCVGYSSLLMLSRVLFCFVSLFFHYFFFWFALQGEVEIDDDDLSTLEVRLFSKMFMSAVFSTH